MESDAGGGYRKIASGPQSVLGATLVALGTDRRFVEAATGLDFGVDAYRFASDAHTVSIEDAERITEIITERGRSGPTFWTGYVRRGTTAANELTEKLRSLATVGDRPGPAQLLDGFTDYAESVKAITPFAVLTPLARPVLESALAAGIVAHTRGSIDLEGAGRLVEQLGEAWHESEARSEVRNCYRIASEILNSDAAAGILRTTSASIGLRRIEEELPEISGLIAQHVDAYGWLRARGHRAEPLTPKDLVDRLQVIVMRWPVEQVEHLARPKAVPDIGDTLGFSPSGSLAELLVAFRAMVAERAFGIDLALQAEWVARPFLGVIAGALGCTLQQVLFSSVDEIVAGLPTGAGLPTEDADRRFRDGFVVERSDRGLEVSVDPAPSAERGAWGPQLSGMTGCRGRAVGPVKVIRDVAELRRLEIGDVLVTAASTTDMMGGSTVFPTRGGGPPAIDKAIAVVADEGGLLSHAAIVCRERGIPCVLGTESATRVLSDGEIVEVDATRATGTVLRLGPS
jgi:phosphohistidine swiveling domain-containing protein